MPFREPSRSLYRDLRKAIALMPQFMLQREQYQTIDVGGMPFTVDIEMHTNDANYSAPKGPLFDRDLVKRLIDDAGVRWSETESADDRIPSSVARYLYTALSPHLNHGLVVTVRWYEAIGIAGDNAPLAHGGKW